MRRSSDDVNDACNGETKMDGFEKFNVLLNVAGLMPTEKSLLERINEPEKKSFQERKVRLRVTVIPSERMLLLLERGPQRYARGLEFERILQAIALPPPAQSPQESPFSLALEGSGPRPVT